MQMASDTNLNSIISQGIAIKQIYNPKKQSLELQQHFNAQHTEIEKEKKKSKVKKPANGNPINKAKEERDVSQIDERGMKKKEQEKEKEDKSPNSDGNFIDIKV
jgi:hypothetical protein